VTPLAPTPATHPIRWPVPKTDVPRGTTPWRIVPGVLPSLRESIAHELSGLRARDRFRQSPAFHAPAPPVSRTRGVLGGRPVLNFCSNDYLGLACHPALADAARASLDQAGLGAAASRLISGELEEHRRLEQVIASFVSLPTALLFPTGYQANIGLVTALANGSDLVVSDAANHASLIDGCRLSRAAIRVYPHRDVAAARAALTEGATAYRRRILLTESLFSMDGDTAPLADLAEMTAAVGAALLVDEAHALGVLGPSGRGLCARAGVVPDALVGTLGKAFGCFGGFVAGSPDLHALLQNRARTFIFTTAAPPALAAAAAAAFAIAAGPEGERRRSDLTTNTTKLLARLSDFVPREHASPIVPLILGEDRRALAVSRALLERGLFVQAIRPPTVPEGTARLRLTLSADHTSSEVTALTDALRNLLATT
jgi:8-amino-7-oxononanoate synthase